MPLTIRDPEVMGVTASSVTLAFRVDDDAGATDATARVLLDGELRARSEGATAARLVRIEGLDPDTEYTLTIEVDGAASPVPDRYFPERVRTLPAPRARRTATFATLNDLHFGEPRFGGQLTADHEYGDAAEGFPLIRADDTEVPYWRVMNEDAIAEINAASVDAVVVKGDIADRGLPEQFGFARDAFAKLRAAAPRLPRQPRLLRPPQRSRRGRRLRAARTGAGPAQRRSRRLAARCCSRPPSPATITASSTMTACSGSARHSPRPASRRSRRCC